MPIFINALLKILILTAWFCCETAPNKVQNEIDVTIQSSITYQKIEGFGASINGWNREMFPIYRDEDYLDFVINELGLSIFRMQIWPKVSMDPIAEVEEIRHEDFVWRGEGRRGRVNMDFAKAILEKNPEIKIIGSIWSPSPWMKDNNSFTGTKSGYLLDPNRTWDDDNRLSDDMYEHHAKWIYEWIEYMHVQGVPLYALGPQNEPMFTQSFGSCMYTGEEYARLVKTIGKRFEKEDTARPLIYGPEDMTLATYNPNGQGETRHTPYVDALLKEDVASYFDIFATHGYTDGVNAGGKLDPEAYWESIKQFNRPYWITEGGTGEHDWPAPITNGIASFIHHALTDGNASAFVAWQISEPEKNIHGLMDMKTPTKKTYAAMHFWRYIRPGFSRIEASGGSKDFNISAYQAPDKQRLVIVLINNSDVPQKVNISLEDSNSFDFTPYTTSAEQNFFQGKNQKTSTGSLQITMEKASIMTLVGSSRKTNQ